MKKKILILTLYFLIWFLKRNMIDTLHVYLLYTALISKFVWNAIYLKYNVFNLCMYEYVYKCTCILNIIEILNIILKF